MNELCFASNLTSSEWAAWVQAAGTLLALAIAVALPLAQRRAECQTARRVADHFADTVLLAAEAALELACGYDGNRAVTASIHLRNAIALGSTLRLDLLPATSLVAIRGLRGVADMLAENLDRLRAKPDEATNAQAAFASQLEAATIYSRQMGGAVSAVH